MRPPFEGPSDMSGQYWLGAMITLTVSVVALVVRLFSKDMKPKKKKHKPRSFEEEPLE